MRLLLAAKPYAACKGGATVLTTYIVTNTTGPNGRIVTTTVVDHVRNWQVCIK